MRTDDGRVSGGTAGTSWVAGESPDPHEVPACSLEAPTSPDVLSPLDELLSIRRQIRDLEALELEAIWRARVEGVSWRSIASVSGLSSSTVRRWASRDDEVTRRRREAS